MGSPNLEAPPGRRSLVHTLGPRSSSWAMLLAALASRTVIAFVVALLMGALFVGLAHEAPWDEAAPWFTVTGTLVDIASLGLVIVLVRHEGGTLRSLVGYDRARLGRDTLRGFGLLAILMGVGFLAGAVTSLLLFGTLTGPRVMGPLPAWASLYSVVFWPLLWGIAEEVVYVGYALPRVVAKTGRAWLGILLVSAFWALQHAALPLRWDAAFMLWRVVPAFFVAVAICTIYLRYAKGRLVPFIVMHWAVDALSAAGMLLPDLLP